MMLFQDCIRVIEALAVSMPDTRITRGWPKTLANLPCVAVAEAKNYPIFTFGYAIDQLITEIRIYAVTSGETDNLADIVEEVMTGIGYSRTECYDDSDETTRLKILRYTANAYEDGLVGEGGGFGVCTGYGAVYLAPVVVNTQTEYTTLPGILITGVIDVTDKSSAGSSGSSSLYVDEVGGDIYLNRNTIGVVGVIELAVTRLIISELHALGMLKYNNDGAYESDQSFIGKEFALRYELVMADGHNVCQCLRSVRLLWFGEGRYTLAGSRYNGIVMRFAFGDVMAHGHAFCAMMQRDDTNPEHYDSFLSGAEHYVA